MLRDALEVPLATEDPTRGRLHRLLERLDDNLVEI
jgi:hypothetical protein